MRKPCWALLILRALSETGCLSLEIHETGSGRTKAAKVAKCAVLGWGTGWLSKAYDAGRRSRD
jgi:hypothetical protein